MGKLIYLRECMSMTKSQLAKIMQVSVQTILNWEKGFTSPSIKQLKELARIFNVTIDYLCSNDVSLAEKLRNIERKRGHLTNDEIIYQIKELFI